MFCDSTVVAQQRISTSKAYKKKKTKETAKVVAAIWG